VINVPDLKGFFRPTQSIENLLPTIMVVLILMLVALGLWAMYAMYQDFLTKSNAWKRFSNLTKRYGVSRSEFYILRTLAEKANLANPSRILTDSDLFGRIVRQVERVGCKKDKRMVLSLREKLFNQTLTPDESIRTTHSLNGGIRLFIKSPTDSSKAIWGHLVDNEDRGLIVAIPCNRDFHFPMRIEPHLEITAYVPDHNPATFITWVKSVIPGPKKIIVLEHSNFVVEKKTAPQNHKSGFYSRVKRGTQSPTAFPAHA
jgi:hypothetical protein